MTNDVLISQGWNFLSPRQSISAGDLAREAQTAARSPSRRSEPRQESWVGARKSWDRAQAVRLPGNRGHAEAAVPTVPPNRPVAVDANWRSSMILHQQTCAITPHVVSARARAPDAKAALGTGAMPPPSAFVRSPGSSPNACRRNLPSLPRRIRGETRPCRSLTRRLTTGGLDLDGAGSRGRSVRVRSLGSAPGRPARCALSVYVATTRSHVESPSKGHSTPLCPRLGDSARTMSLRWRHPAVRGAVADR